MPRSVLAVFAVVVVFGIAASAAYWSLRERTGGAEPDGASTEDRPCFRERARESGIDFHMAFLADEQGANFRINLYDHGCGVAVADYDGDGHDDIYFCNQLGKNALFRNKGDGTFEDVTEKAGVGLGDRVCVAATFADTRNNGLQDLYVTSTRGGNVFFRNMGDGTFKDVTKEAGLTLVAHSQTAVFFDYDNDGFLDLLVTNTAKWTLDDYSEKSHHYPGPLTLEVLMESPKEHNVLYHNNGDGTFTDVTSKAGLSGKGWGGDVAVFDYDEDGHIDLLITNMFGASQLYHNNGNGTFTDVTKDILGYTSWGAIGSKVFDFNNDGHLDLLIVDMHSDMWLDHNTDPRTLSPETLIRKFPNSLGLAYHGDLQEQAFVQMLAEKLQFNYEDVVFGNTLFKHLPSGKFEEISDKAKMETFWPWGIATGDFDNDGFEDVFLPSGMGYPYGYWPNALMMNNGDETFSDRAAALGIEPPPGGRNLDVRLRSKPAPRSSRCVATADFAGTGRLDLVVNNFNDRAFYFRNYFPEKNWIAFHLRGTKSNRDAIGAVVRIYAGNEVMTRQVNPAGGYLSQSSRTVQFGLGDRPAVDRVVITWPGGGKQTIEHPTINQLSAVTEAVR